MGGQQFGTDTVLLDTRALDRITGFDPETGLLEAEAGILWPELVRGYLALQKGCRRQWGIAQKQTGADRLSLGGALSANVHGRGLTRKPLVGDIESFRIVGADGKARWASRTQAPELFRAAIGGYGLLGVVHSVVLRLVPRVKVERIVELARVDDLVAGFAARIRDGFTYGDFQFAIDPRSAGFLDRGVFSCYRPVADDVPVPESQRELSAADWRRLVYLAHADKSEGFRLYAEHYLATSGQVYWSDAHQLGVYLDDYHAEIDARLGGPPASEVITEVFVPPPALADFLAETREDFRRHGVNLIYGTVRRIERDDETLLPWARGPYLGTVFNLHTEHTPAGIAGTASTVRRLIAAALRRGGSYFLTYGRHATRRQMAACYPRFGEFVELKRRVDPRGLFASDWYRHYREGLC
jgi:FAD/FMN-containing dehydrogenase